MAENFVNRTEDTIPAVAMGEEVDNALLRANETDILSALLTAANYKTDEENFQPIEISRNGRLLFSFTIRPLSEEEYNKCREKHTKYVRNRNVGLRVPDGIDTDAYRSELIYRATIERDQEKIWGEKKAWQALDVLSGPQLISKVLLAGEKNAICEKIDEISGYNNNDSIEFAKN